MYREFRMAAVVQFPENLYFEVWIRLTGGLSAAVM